MRGDGMMLSRRSLLAQVASVGGSGAAAAVMHAMGMFGVSQAQASISFPSDTGRGRRVVVLGAGIAGLVSAYELEQAGFDVTVVEARARVGGRILTLRDGDRLDLIGEASQTARFPSGDYFNAGAARLPSWHEGILGYVRKFKVPLEVQVNATRSSYIVAGNGSRLRMRTAINDLRGHLSELLAKALDQGSLDRAITEQDKTRLKPLLRFYGDLDGEDRFLGTKRSGLVRPPGTGAGAFGEAPAPVSLDDLLAHEMLATTVFEDDLFMQATMFQPVGGMDRIPMAIASHLRRPPVLGAEVTQIRQRDGGGEVAARDIASGAVRRFAGDFLICTLPFNVLAKIDTNFAGNVRAAIAGVTHDHATKIAFDASRFWERDQIYGGISFVGGETSMIWYPSHGFQDERGVLVGCYTLGPPAEPLERRTLAEQIAVARAAIERAHPGQADVCDNPLVINWSKVPFIQGPWPNWTGPHSGPQEERIDTPAFRLLSAPQGHVFFAGAALSQTPSWQEGAVASAQAAVTAIVRRTAALPDGQSTG